MKPVGDVNRIEVLYKDYKKQIRILSLIIFIVAILGITACIEGMKVATKYEALKIENNELNKVVEMQKSIISDLQEDNMKLQEMIK